MTQKPVTVIQLRRDTTTNWETNNPVLRVGEPGLDTTTGKLKIGNGSAAWNSLGYVNNDTATLATLNDVTLGTLAANDLVMYDGSKWINKTIADAGIATTTQVGLKANTDNPTFTTGITSPAITNSSLTTAGIVTNTSSGVLGTTTSVPIANGGTGVTTGAGWVPVIPTSVTVSAGTGTPSSSVSAAGVVSYTSATTVTVNGIFTADYDHYMIIFSNSSETVADYHYFRYTTGGTPNSTSNYYYSSLFAQGVNGGVGTNANANSFVRFGYDSNTYPAGSGSRRLEISNPYSNTRRTDCVYTTTYSGSDHTLWIGTALFNNTTRFDGIIVGHETVGTGLFTGTMQILGLKK